MTLKNGFKASLYKCRTSTEIFLLFIWRNFCDTKLNFRFLQKNKKQFVSEIRLRITVEVPVPIEMEDIFHFRQHVYSLKRHLLTKVLHVWQFVFCIFNTNCSYPDSI